MRIKLVIGLVLFILGMILQEASYVVDIWMLRVIGGIVWPIGLVLFTNELLFRKKS